MKNRVGPPVEGDDFFGRDDEFNYSWDLLVNGNNLIFPSPRRVGKTSFALRHIAKAKAEGWHTITLNLEKISSEVKFIESLIDELKKLSIWERVKGGANDVLTSIKSLKPKVKYGEVELEFEWKQQKEDIYKKLFGLFNHTEKTLIFIDEITVLLNNILKAGENGRQNVIDFLDMLRSIRQVPKSEIRWIFCSSVGIENFTLKHKISFTTNDTLDYKLRAFNNEDSKAMLQLLGTSNNLPLTDDIVIDTITKLEYCQPFFLQLMFEKIKYLHKIDGLALDKNIVQPAYAALTTEKHFNTWIERIEEQYGDDQTIAFRILKHICQEKQSKRESLFNKLTAIGIDPLIADNKLSNILYMLSNDGYLIEENSLYQFRSPLLRDFWFNRFVK